MSGGDDDGDLFLMDSKTQSPTRPLSTAWGFERNQQKQRWIIGELVTNYLTRSD
jgi:hypothetical protein